MGEDESVTRRLDELDDVLRRLGDVEARLSSVRARRVAMPASLVLFGVLAFVLLRDDIASTSPAGFLWSVLFGVGYVTGLIVNEVAARRAIPRLESELTILLSRFRHRSVLADGESPPAEA